MRGLLQRWTKSSIILTSKEESVWRNKRPRSRTGSFAVGRLLTWFTNNSESLEPIVLSKTTPTCSLLCFEMTIFRNSILSGTEYYCLWRKSHMMTSWKDCSNYEDESLKNCRRVLELYDPGDSSTEVRTWLSQFESCGEEKYRTRNSK